MITREELIEVLEGCPGRPCSYLRPRDRGRELEYRFPCPYQGDEDCMESLMEDCLEYIRPRLLTPEEVEGAAKRGAWTKAGGGGFTTPGGDPVWVCGTCGGDGHVCGVETRYNAHQKCKNCGAINRYPWEGPRND